MSQFVIRVWYFVVDFCCVRLLSVPYATQKLSNFKINSSAMRFFAFIPFASATSHSRVAEEVVYPHGQEGVLPWNFGSSSILEMGADVVSFPGQDGYREKYFSFF